MIYLNVRAFVFRSGSAFIVKCCVRSPKMQLCNLVFWASLFSSSDRCRKEPSTASSGTTSGSSRTSDTTWRPVGRSSSSDILFLATNFSLCFRQRETGDGGENWYKMAAYWLPIFFFTLIWGAVGGVLPRFVPNGPHKQLIQVGIRKAFSNTVGTLPCSSATFIYLHIFFYLVR